jgi:hypothetical protein
LPGAHGADHREAVGPRPQDLVFVLTNIGPIDSAMP